MKRIRCLINDCFRNIKQIYLLKKYKKFNIPIKNKKYWYYKENIKIRKNTKFSIEKYGNVVHNFEFYTNYTLHYHYTYGSFKNISSKQIKKFQDFTHSHDFFDVLEKVYDFPESFKIPNESKCEYSEQELILIEVLQKQFIKDGLKDISYFTESLNQNYFIGQTFNIAELKKRNIKDLYGIKLKKVLKKNSDDDYVILDDNENLLVISNNEL